MKPQSQAGWIYHIRKDARGRVFVWKNGNGGAAKNLVTGNEGRPTMTRYAYGPALSHKGLWLARDLLCDATGRFAIGTAVAAAFYREFLQGLPHAREHLIGQAEIVEWLAKQPPTMWTVESTPESL